MALSWTSTVHVRGQMNSLEKGRLKMQYMKLPNTMGIWMETEQTRHSRIGNETTVLSATTKVRSLWFEIWLMFGECFVRRLSGCTFISPLLDGQYKCTYLLTLRKTRESQTDLLQRHKEGRCYSSAQCSLRSC